MTMAPGLYFKKNLMTNRRHSSIKFTLKIRNLGARGQCSDIQTQNIIKTFE